MERGHKMRLVNFLCPYSKMSYNDSFKKIFFKKSVIFRFVQKISSDCALPKSAKTISNLNNSKISKEQLKV